MRICIIIETYNNGEKSFLMIAYGDYQLIDYDFLMSKTQQLTYMYYLVWHTGISVFKCENKWKVYSPFTDTLFSFYR